MFNPLCSCNIESEITKNYFLCCHITNENRAILINNLENTDQAIPTLNDKNLADLLLYGNEKCNDKKNRTILIFIKKFLKDSQRLPGQFL